ncbi:hypothetical protein KFL_005800040 [Klebsormidium nitens]|uniref:Core-2/I-branching beta-1,6-N-acetylglucosaminyltransferase family protein n=1 Tax=Klebsormidium nitens TaxID=105231 RepID=A0A1Y1IGH2_KLENI|nr:hypothetical protein KFL_005800040 [Klebsormidium nitens]|eukprot:GAQ89945.1 hypothetical protein KFL_005800040 [Klebsormidium nitens]
MAAWHHLDTMALKASARGPALILFTAFGLLLTGAVFLVFSTALSAGVLSPARALAFSPHTNFPSVSLAGLFITTQRSKLPEALQESANQAELSLRNGSVAESTEAVDLMLPSDPKARVDILISQLDEGTRAKTALDRGVAERSERSIARLRGSKDELVGAPAKASSVAELTETANLTDEAVLESVKNSTLGSAGELNQTDEISKNAVSNMLNGPDADELFEAYLNAKALAVDQKTEKGPVSKIAFLFLTRGPLFHERLWQRYFEGNENRYSIYVHASKDGFVYNETTSQAQVFHDRQIKSIKVTWGGLNMVRAERRLLAQALIDRNNERFVLVSESCIPIRSFDYTYKYLFELDKSFISSFHTTWRYKNGFGPIVQKHQWRKGAQARDSPANHFFLTRGSITFFLGSNQVSKYCVHTVNTDSDACSKAPGTSALSESNKPRFHWFTLTRPHARLVVGDAEMLNRLQSSKAQIADEHYIQTLLPMKDSEGLVPRPVTYAAWMKRKASHPHTFIRNMTSLAAIREIQAMTRPVEEDSSYGKGRHVFDECAETGTLRPCYLFARKFTKDTTRVLLPLADEMWAGPESGS